MATVEHRRGRDEKRSEGKRHRLLFISHNASRTGAPIILLSFLKWLKRNTPHQIGIILQNSGPLLEEFSAVGPTVNLDMQTAAAGRLSRYVSRLVPTTISRQRKQIRRLMMAGGPYDLLYANSITNGSVLQLLTEYRLPTITHVHELAYWIERCGEKNLTQVKQCTSGYIAASQAVKDHLVVNCGVAAEQVDVAYEFVEKLPSMPSREDRQRARQSLNIPEGAFVVGACGAEYWRKGRDLIVHLLLAIKRRRSTQPIYCVWVGQSGTPEEAYQIDFDLRKAGVVSMFRFTGEVANPFFYYAAFDLFALVSRDDPFPLVCLETAALGVPILCFAGAGGMPEFVAEGCGAVVPYLDVDAMAEEILRLAREDKTRFQMGQRARGRVQERHTLDDIAPRILALIDTQIAKNPLG